MEQNGKFIVRFQFTQRLYSKGLYWSRADMHDA